MSRPTLRVLLALGAILIACGCSPKPEAVAETPIPQPETSHLSKPQRAVIEQAQSKLDRAMSEPPAVRGRAWGELAEVYNGLDLRLEAVNCYQKAIQLQPQESRWPYLLGLLYQELAKPEMAFPHFQNVAKLDPNYLPNLLAIADYQMRQGDNRAAAAGYQKVLELDPEQVLAIAGLATLSLESRDFQAALEWAQKGLAIAPEVSRLHYLSAMALRGLGEFQKAEISFAKSQELQAKLPLHDPYFQPVQDLAQRHEILIAEGLEAEKTSQFGIAEKKFTEAIAWQPKSARVHYEYGRLLNRTGRYQEAIPSLEKSASLGPDQAPVDYQLGIARNALGQGDAALVHMKAAAANTPEMVFYHLKAGDLARRLRKFPDALQIYNLALTHFPKDWRLIMGKVLCQIYLDRDSDAASILAGMAGKPQTPAPFYLLLARLYAASPDNSVRDGAQALKLIQGLAEQGVNLDYLETGAMAMAEAGDFKQAVDWQNAALELASKSLQRDLSARLRQRLTLYKQGTPCREPFEKDAKIFFEPLG